MNKFECKDDDVIPCNKCDNCQARLKYWDEINGDDKTI